LNEVKTGVNLSFDDSVKEVSIRPPLPETQITFLHKRIQKEIYNCLVKQDIPGRVIQVEVGGIDILVHERGVATMIEIKTGENIIFVIREALGQLLEYRYFCRGDVGINPRLLIVSPLKITNEAVEYLEFLKRAYSLRLGYLQYVPGSNFFALPYDQR
jgi:hypothetical protein